MQPKSSTKLQIRYLKNQQKSTPKKTKREFYKSTYFLIAARERLEKIKKTMIAMELKTQGLDHKRAAKVS